MSFLQRRKGSAKQHSVVTQFDAYQDGVLTQRERAVYEQHLKICAVCREWVAQQKDLAVQLALEKAPATALAPAAAARIQKSLYGSMRRAVIMNNVRTSVAAVGALAVLALMVGAVAWWQSSGFGNTLQAPTISQGSDVQKLTLSSQAELDNRVIEAVGQGNVVVLAEALEEGADPNAESSPGRPALFLATRQGNAEAVSLLIDAGADIHATTVDGAILVTAAREGYREIVEMLLDAGADVDSVGRAWDGGNGSALWAAADNNHGELAQLLIERGADVNAVDVTGVSVLMLAASNNMADIVTLLLENGADIDQQANNGATALHGAGLHPFRGISSPDAARVLIEHGAALNIKDAEGRTPLDIALPDVAEILREAGAKAGSNQSALDDRLLEAIGEGDVAALTAALEDGTDPNAVDAKGNAALALAAREGQLEVVQLLLAAGADANGTLSLPDADNVSALGQAASNNHIEIVKLLIAHGADVNQAEEQYDRTPLHGAAWNNHVEIVTILLENGADPNAHSTWPNGDAQGETPLHFAARNKAAEAVQALLAGGADINIQTNRGLTPLLHGDVLANSEMAALLLESGADPNALDIYGNTALHVAAMEFIRNRSIPVLIEHGASVDVQNNAGDTALHFAAQWNNVDAAALLLEHGASADLANEKGQTALDLATNERIVEMLRAAGAEGS